MSYLFYPFYMVCSRKIRLWCNLSQFPPPATKAGGTHSPGVEGDGGSVYWKTREIGLPSYSKICTLWVRVLFVYSVLAPLPAFISFEIQQYIMKGTVSIKS